MTREESKKFIKAITKDGAEVFSHSKLSSAEDCPYESYIKYYLEKKGDSIYTKLGNVVHDLCENYVLGKETSNEKMLEKFRSSFNKYTMVYDFPTEKSKNAYKENVELFLENFKGLPEKYKGWRIMTEQFVIYELSKDRYIQGFLDIFMVSPDETEFAIVDWKTSTRYVGKDKEKHSYQLLLYSEAIKQLTHYKKSHVMWNFLKYARVEYKLMSGKVKVANWERKEVNDKLWALIKKRFIDQDMNALVLIKIKRDFYTKGIIDESLLKKPMDIQIFDCYEECESDNVTEKVNEHLTHQIAEWYKREAIGEEAYPPKKLFESKGSELSFFCEKLCTVKKYCKHYQKLEKKLKSLEKNVDKD